MAYTYGNIIAGEREFPAMKMVVEFDSLASEDSGRDDEGEMHIEWIKERLRKVKITLPPMSQRDVALALDAVLGKKYYIEYIDPIDGLKQLYVYTSAGSAEMYNARIHGGLWHNISFNAIEVGGVES